MKDKQPESELPIGVEIPDKVLKVKPNCCDCGQKCNIFYSYKGKDQKWFCRPCLDKFVRSI